jgi:hypothetical protein
MNFTPILLKSESKKSHYTNLFACITEEDASFSVQVRLYSQVSPAEAAWGEEIADSLQAASMLVNVLAAEFSIARERIELELRMLDPKAGTRH